MDIQNANEFKEKVDEILKDTRDFVNATKQLNSIRNEMEQYIKEAFQIYKNLNNTAIKTSECADYASKIFNDELTKKIETLFGRMDSIMEDCLTQSQLLKEQYDELLKSDNFVELQKDHSNILDSIDDTSEKVTKVIESQNIQAEKLDKIIELLQSKFE